MIIAIECLFSIIIFTTIILLSLKLSPKQWVYDYPKGVVEKCKEIGYIEDGNPKITIKVVLRKLFGCIFFALIFALMITYINKGKTFLYGFVVSYLIWFVVCWYDCFFLDFILACNSKKFRFPGTENDDELYKDYWFHIKQSLIGSVLGLIVAVIVGLFVMLLNLY